MPTGLDAAVADGGGGGGGGGIAEDRLMAMLLEHVRSQSGLSLLASAQERLSCRVRTFYC